MLSEYIGGGSLIRLRVTIRPFGDRSTITIPLPVRSGIFSSDIGVGQGAVGSRYRGTIVIPRWNERLITALRANGQRVAFGPELLTHVLLDDVFEALRQQEEILWRYGASGNGERQSLWAALQSFEELNLLCLGLKTVVDRATVEAVLQVHVERALEALGLKPRNIEKVEAIGYLAHLTTVLDRCGRPNPSAKAAQSLAGKRRVGARVETVDSIEPIIAYRRQILQKLLDHLTFTFEGIHHFLETFFLKEIELGSVNDSARLRRVIARLVQFSVDLMRVDVRPFVLTTDHLRREFIQAISSLRTHNIGDAKTILRRSWQSLKLRRIRLELEAVITEVARHVQEKRLAPTVAASVARRQEFVDRLSAISSHLRQVDETGFYTRVTTDAVVALASASELLTQKTFVIEHLKEAKAHLKSAAERL